MRNVLLVGIGGFIGSVLRYLITGYVQTLSKSIKFPYGTLCVNLVGCFLIGFLAYVAEDVRTLSVEARVFLFTGILGGFTTFSAFGHETLTLLRENRQLLALANVALHIVIGLGFAWAGRVLAERIWE